MAAAYLKMSEADFIRDYLEEHIEGDALPLSPKFDRKGGSWFLAQRRVKRAGELRTMNPEQRARGSCVFFEGGRCRIHPVKPYECRKVYGCEGERRHKRIREIIIRRWKR